MKKILFVSMLLIITGCSLLLLTGCSEPEGVIMPETCAQDISPSLLRTGDITMKSGYCYLVDKNTGVVYLEFDNINRHAVTLMVNADGTSIK